MTTNTSTPAITAAEAVLGAAGVSFSVVEACTDHRCSWCRAATLVAAA